ncbi:MAG: hypothetical protein R3332_08350 [Pseudohongiellaceae bacterium]|nr:hypothetical protein [Pseudohongiellaceae bacterium]
MPTDSERGKAFNEELLRIRREYARLHKETPEQLKRIVEQALAQIQDILRSAPTDYQTWLLPQFEAQIKQILENLSQQATSTTQNALAAAWANGIATTDSPLLAAGISISAALPVIDQRQLAAITHLATSKIQGISDKTKEQINTHLALVMLGVESYSDAITVITTILEQEVRYVANRILRTELARANSIAGHLRKVQSAEYLPGLKKQWRRSGRKYPRETHTYADGQIRELDEPFDIGDVHMQHPHDPSAPASEVINCGCLSLPYMDSWEVKYKGRRDIPS